MNSNRLNISCYLLQHNNFRFFQFKFKIHFEIGMYLTRDVRGEMANERHRTGDSLLIAIHEFHH